MGLNCVKQFAKWQFITPTFLMLTLNIKPIKFLTTQIIMMAKLPRLTSLKGRIFQKVHTSRRRCTINFMTTMNFLRLLRTQGIFKGQRLTTQKLSNSRLQKWTKMKKVKLFTRRIRSIIASKSLLTISLIVAFPNSTLIKSFKKIRLWKWNNKQM